MAPAARELGTIELQGKRLLIYSIQFIQRVPYSSVRPSQGSLSDEQLRWQNRLVSDFARFAARGWAEADRCGRTRHCDGKVGKCIEQKLEQLSEQLPTGCLRSYARRTAEQLDRLQILPTVFCHGDVLPSNILVNPIDGSIHGLVDWAEAENLPFGTCLYGLEHLLGYLTESSGFHYYEQSERLREVFWRELYEGVADLRNNEELQLAVSVARDTGVLLWYGFAWDEGAINRVVNLETDPQELEFLQAFSMRSGFFPG